MSKIRSEMNPFLSVDDTSGSCTVIGSSTEILMLTITNEAALTVALLSPWKKINLEDTEFGVVIVWEKVGGGGGGGQNF